jgi:hypothetical protein
MQVPYLLRTVVLILRVVMSLSGGEQLFDTRGDTALRGESIMDSNLSVLLAFPPPPHRWRQKD